MVLSEESDQTVEQRFLSLCADLNMDKSTALEAWHTYERIGENYTLEGDSFHWLACALYVACRSSSLPTVGGNPSATVEGNCVSLTRLLRSCQLSLLHFFTKMKKWADMANLPQEFRNKVDRLERNFAVSTVIFKKFKPIFCDIFKEPSEDVPRAKSRKQRRLPCTSAELFSFCWTLFVQVKGNFSTISDDLVNSYHLLLDCIDLIFSNVILADRRDLLNLKFSGLPENFGARDYKPPLEPPCIIKLLCEKHDGLFLEAKCIKEHWWKLNVKKLFDKKILKGRVDTLSGLLDPGNFEVNNKSINNAYETYVLNVGDFDERIFLASEANKEIGIPAKSTLTSAGDFTEQMNAKMQRHLDATNSLTPQTPLTGRRYLRDKEIGSVTPVSTATQNVSKLQTLLSGRKTSPSEVLVEIFKECSKNCMDMILNLIQSMGEKFCTCCAQPFDNHAGSPIDFAKKRLQLGESLYYKALESMMVLEKKRLPANFDYAAILEQELLHRTLFACCLEIVIFSYNSQRTFPWIIEIFEIEPYDFYKIIEMLIRAEDGLSRDVVKHLNHIEEQILESMAWKSDSPLWHTIKNCKSSGQPIPSCEDVSLPDQSESMSAATIPQAQLLTSPVPHPTIKRLTTLDRQAIKNPQQSPVAPSLAERFQSPGANGTVSSARRRLFAAAPVPVKAARSVTVATTTTSVVNKSQASETVLLASSGGANVVLSPQKALFVQSQGERGCIAYIPTQYVTIPITNATLSSQLSTNLIPSLEVKAANAACRTPKPKKMGSFGLFFRKFYYLAGVRLRALCDSLGICAADESKSEASLKTEELRKKIWTCFEHCLIHHTDLMVDRHLDQFIMCAIYVVCKVSDHNTSFHDIISFYRLQPQSASHAYRSVLLHSKKVHDLTIGSSEGSKNERSESNSPSPMDKEEEKEKDEKRIRSSSTLPVDHHSNSQPPTPTQMAGMSSSFEFEDRGDIISFYNSIYVPKMQSFVLKFSNTNRNNGAKSPTLSPLPVPKAYTMSPRKVSSQHSVFISPLKSSQPPNRLLSYSFNSSPAKNLRAINNMVRQGSDCRIGKRILQEDGDSELPAKRNCIVTRIQNVITERQGLRGSGLNGTNGEAGEAQA